MSSKTVVIMRWIFFVPAGLAIYFLTLGISIAAFGFLNTGYYLSQSPLFTFLIDFFSFMLSVFVITWMIPKGKFIPVIITASIALLIIVSYLSLLFVSESAYIVTGPVGCLTGSGLAYFLYRLVFRQNRQKNNSSIDHQNSRSAIQCDNCRTINGINARFCIACGNTLDKQEHSSTAS